MRWLALACVALAACATHAPTMVMPSPGSTPHADRHLVERGVALALWDVRAPDLVTHADAAFAELAALGATSVLIPMRFGQHDVASPTVTPRDEVTLADDDLVRIVAAARGHGLGVMLLPIVDLEIIAQGSWRGTLAPPDREVWWQSYRACLVHLADVADRAGVTWLAVGSELGSLDVDTERWWALIGEVRGHFHGQLTYSANWDHYQCVHFWDRLDAVGVSSYPPLAELTHFRDDVVAFAAAQDKPILLTEVGYPATAAAATAPWDYTSSSTVDIAAQARSYAAFAQAWSKVSTLIGVYVWIWDGAGGQSDAGYTPRGKPALFILRAFYERSP